MDHLPDLEEALNQLPRRHPVVLGDLNAYIARLSNPQYQQVSEFLASLGLVDLLGHLCQRLRYCRLQTWWKIRQGRVLLSCCDYDLV